MARANQITQDPAASQASRNPSTLPETGYIRQRQLIGEPSVSPEQAEHNRQAGKGIKRPRPGYPAIVPWSSATLWRKVKTGDFVAPVKLSDGITAWSVEAVRAWLQAKQMG
jgi:prophage regulatory protein